MIWLALIAMAISGSVALVRLTRFEFAVNRALLGWTGRVEYHHEGVSSHVIESYLRDNCGMLVGGDSQGGLGVSFVFKYRPGWKIPPTTTARLTFRTDRKAHISGPVNLFLLGEDRLLFSYANVDTLPKLIGALADSERYFEVWATCSAWRFDRYRRFESASFRAPARALLADAEKGIAAAREALQRAEQTEEAQVEAERAEVEHHTVVPPGQTIH